MENYRQVIEKHSQSMREKRDLVNKIEGNYLASVKIDDLVHPTNPRDVLEAKMTLMKGFLG